MLTGFTELIARDHNSVSNFKINEFKKSDYIGCFTVLAFFISKIR